MPLGGVIVIRRFDVYEKDLVVGTVILGRRGLYWAVSCRCDAEKGRGKRLIAEVDAGCVDLGLLYPVDGGFGLETSVAVKTLGEGRMCFRLENRAEETRFVALDPLKAFAYLHLLEQCRFAVRDGVSGLLLPGKK